MTTVASIIKSALRETNLIPLGVDPTVEQSNEAFSRLSTIVASVLGNQAGEQLNPLPLGQNDIEAPHGYPWWNNELPGNTYVMANTRIMCNLTGPGFVNFPVQPHDGARMGIVDVSQNFDICPLTLFGNGRNIEGDSDQTFNVPGTIRQWVYREDLGDWITVIPLVADGEMPWPPEFDDMFIIMLAMRLNPRYGQVMHPASVEALKQATTQFSARYTQDNVQMPVEDGLLYLPSNYRFGNRYGLRGYGDPNQFFLNGYVYGS